VIVAIGVDIVEVSRIRIAMENPRFAARILTLRELSIGSTVQFIAGRWAAKEAVAKAVGTHLTWQDVEILPDQSGRPIAIVDPAKLDLVRFRLHVSISHEKGHAVGIAVLESAPPPTTNS